ncbi:hypothetical protein ACLI1A_02610 [Flavobacterium sp. RHBU_3]|uniref:hypothetical protein n=1 Tax=Flavobacterium sp. RHBU_3 TaxID=3391184 RepID=UPI0039854016
MYRLLFFILFLSVNLFGQENCIKIKLNLTHNEDYTFTYENARLILTGNGRNDTLRPNRELEFNMENLTKGDYQFRIIPNNSLDRTTEHYYKFHFDTPAQQKHPFEITYSPFCPYSIENKTCPVCCTEKHVIPVRYGLIAVIEKRDKNGNIINDDKKKFKAGGCVVSDCDPQWYCEQDDVKF